MVKNFFKLDQTLYRVSPLYIESIMSGIFAKAEGKMLVLPSEI